MPAIDPPVSRGTKNMRFDDAAIERLEFLLIDGLPAGGLPLEAIDGLFSGAWVSPGTPLTLDDLSPLIFGDAAESAPEELRQLLGLMWDSIGRRIARGPTANPDDCLPLIGIPPELEDVPDEEISEEHEAFFVGSAWAVGFLLAYNLRAPEWELRLEEDEDIAWDVMDIFALMPPLPEGEADEDDDIATHTDDDDDADIDGDLPEPDEEDEPVTFQERIAIIGALPEILYGLHQLATEERTPRTPARREEAPSRNDPCPCGSGKKFKKCHGDPSRLN